MGRETRRVPLDFDWPLNETWGGFLLPERLREDNCAACDGEGYSPEARAIADTFYPHMIEWGNTEKANRLAWHDKIGQAEVDHLIGQGRLRVWRDGEWRTEPRTAAEINAANRDGGLDGHDAINRGILIEFRCDRLGIPCWCSTCEGHGSVEKFPGQRAEAEAWEPTGPPTGDGWQMWETTSEGSPISPVFATAEELAAYCAEHVGVFGSNMASQARWLAIIEGEDFAHTKIAPGVIIM